MIRAVSFLSRAHPSAIPLHSTSAFAGRRYSTQPPCKLIDVTPQEFMGALQAQCDLSGRVIRVRGDVNIDDAELSLPDGVVVAGDLRFSHMHPPSQLPSQWTVLRSVHLKGSKLKEFPDGWVVGRNLLLSHSPELRALSALGSIGGSIHVEGCTQLARLPEMEMQIGQHLVMNGSGLEDLPDWVLRLGATQDSNVREIRLTNTSLSVEALDRLREVESQMKEQKSETMRFYI